MHREQDTGGMRRPGMDSLGQNRSFASNGGRVSVVRGSERLVANDGVSVAPRDHPMLQTGNQSQQEVKKTHYPYKEPRIDQRMYQAEIPRLQGRASNRAVTRGSLSPRSGEIFLELVSWVASDEHLC